MTMWKKAGILFYFFTFFKLFDVYSGCFIDKVHDVICRPLAIYMGCKHLVGIFLTKA